MYFTVICKGIPKAIPALAIDIKARITVKSFFQLIHMIYEILGIKTYLLITFCKFYILLLKNMFYKTIISNKN